jgi:hypothetical protein
MTPCPHLILYTRAAHCCLVLARFYLLLPSLFPLAAAAAARRCGRGPHTTSK